MIITKLRAKKTVTIIATTSAISRIGFLLFSVDLESVKTESGELVVLELKELSNKLEGVKVITVAEVVELGNGEGLVTLLVGYVLIKGDIYSVAEEVELGDGGLFVTMLIGSVLIKGDM